MHISTKTSRVAPGGGFLFPFSRARSPLSKAAVVTEPILLVELACDAGPLVLGAVGGVAVVVDGGGEEGSLS